MALQHRRPSALQLLFERCNDARMIVTRIMHAISRKKIEDRPSVIDMQFDALTAIVLDIHLQQIEKLCPLRIHMRPVQGMT